MTPEQRARYNTRMQKSLPEKMFFAPMLYGEHDIDLTVDFGCADGALLRALDGAGYRQPHQLYIGYDRIAAQLPANRAIPPGIAWVNDPHVLDTMILRSKGTKLLILSSILHEVMPLGTHNYHLWQLPSHFDYVAIRDMYWIGPSGYLGKNVQKHLKSFYKDNWEHEQKEDYFALTPERLSCWMLAQNLAPVYFRTYTPQWLWDNRLEQEFGHEDHFTTHVQAIFKRFK